MHLSSTDAGARPPLPVTTVCKYCGCGTRTCCRLLCAADAVWHCQLGQLQSSRLQQGAPRSVVRQHVCDFYIFVCVSYIFVFSTFLCEFSTCVCVFSTPHQSPLMSHQLTTPMHTTCSVPRRFIREVGKRRLPENVEHKVEVEGVVEQTALVAEVGHGWQSWLGVVGGKDGNDGGGGVVDCLGIVLVLTLPQLEDLGLKLGLWDELWWFALCAIVDTVGIIIDTLVAISNLKYLQLHDGTVDGVGEACSEGGVEGGDWGSERWLVRGWCCMDMAR